MDINKLMQQAQQMQQKMAEVQEGLKDETVQADAGGGMVKVVFNGCQELVSLSLDPAVVKADEVEFLEDLLVAAFQEGHKKAGQLAQDQMRDLTGGLPFPGLG